MIEDMLESINKIEDYTNNVNFKEFANDSKTIDAVIRNIEIIGEAANRMPKHICNQHPEIDWKAISGSRHKIIHGYFGIDLNTIWKIVDQDLPELKLKLEIILK